MGSSLGNREAQLSWALDAIDYAFAHQATSSLYESAAVDPRGGLDVGAPAYLNTVWLGRHDADVPGSSPESLVAYAKHLEYSAGRRRRRRFAPRVLDVDLLFVGREHRTAPQLTLPHPGLAERRFVLAPLAEIAPALRVPPDGVATVAECLARCSAPPVLRRAWTRRRTRGSDGPDGRSEKA